MLSAMPIDSKIIGVDLGQCREVLERRMKNRQPTTEQEQGDGVIPSRPVQKSSNNMQCAEYALIARKLGLCVMPAIEDGTKQPFGNSISDRRWTHYQKELPSEAKIREWYGTGLTNIGYVCGKVSGNLEALDFDEREIYDIWRQLVIDFGYADLLERLESGYRENSPNGVHLLYRCPKISGSAKLATRPKRSEEMKSNGDRIKTLIETKGEGGYIISAPSNGAVNPSGEYSLISGSIATIPTIMPSERSALFHIAQLFQSYPAEVCEAERKRHTMDTRRDGGQLGDDYNEKADWRDILEPHGWNFLFERNGKIFLRRPGKNDGVSATINYQGNDLLHVFTSSTEFAQNQSCSKFAAYAILNHNGDFKAATKQLAEEGYGNGQPLGGFDGAEFRNWPKPLPLPEGLPPVEQLIPEMLPDAIRPWLFDMADRMEIPPDYAAVAALTALSSLIGRGCGIRPKRHDDWLVVPNLWGAIVGPPSFLKTPASTEAMKPLDRLEIEAKEIFEAGRTKHELEAMVVKARRDHFEKKLKEAISKGEDYSVSMGCNTLSETEKTIPARKRYFTADATPEKIIELLNQNPRGLLIKRDELIGWLRGLDKDNRKGSRALFLEGWNGTGRYSYDTISRGTVDVEALTLSVFGAITPGPLAEYVYSANKGSVGDDGLLQRFQLIVWPDPPKEWRNVDRWPDTQHKNRAFDVFKQLSGDIPGAITENEGGIPFLRFSSDGQAIFDGWRFELENRLRGENKLHPALESHLGKYRSLMPSLALIIHLIDVVSGTVEPGPVSENAAVMAVGWCEYLESHATKVYSGTTSPAMLSAGELLKHIHRGAINDGNSIKEVYRHEWAKLTTPEEVKAGLKVLEDYDWLMVEKTGTGGRPSEIIRLNPNIS
jgi:putative DNA primase/helicase